MAFAFTETQYSASGTYTLTANASTGRILIMKRRI